MYGNWEYDDDPNALIPYDNIIDIFTNPVQEIDDKYLVCDVARYGNDKTTISLWRGLVCYRQDEMKGAGVDVVSNRIKRFSLEERIPFSHIIIDEDGIGGGVVDTLRGVKGFVANTRPFENKISHKKENFANLKTQCSYKLADYINEHKIRIDCDEDAIKVCLIEELEQIKSKDSDKDSRLKIIGKDEIKENIGRSPDWSDNLMMRMWFEINPSNFRERAITFYPNIKNSSIEKNGNMPPGVINDRQSNVYGNKYTTIAKQNFQ
jgi:hypothetical protein